MDTRRLALATLLALALVVGMPATAAQANAGPPRPKARMAFEFFDERSQPVIPTTLQLAGCQDQRCQAPVLLYETPRMMKQSICKLPGCLASPADMDVPGFSCTQENACRVDAGSFGSYPYYTLIIIPRSGIPPDAASVGVFEGRVVAPTEIRGLRVVVTVDGLDITDDDDIRDRTPPPPDFSYYCDESPSSAMIGFAITQAVELLVALLCLLVFGVARRLIGGALLALGLINLATFPVVWLTFPALGPAGPTTQAQAVAALTLLVALLYAGLLVRLRPAFDPARRAMVIGLLAVVLPMVTALVFGAASAASAAAGALGAAGTAGAGLPYTVTMPASEVFAYSAEALLLFLLCRPALSARQAILLSVLANSASLALGLMVL